MHGSASGSAGAGSLQRVTKDSLENQLTAKGLIGKNVHDSSGEKIGEVEDIVLAASQLSQLASAFADRDADRSSAVRSTTGVGSTADATRSASVRSDLESQASSMISGAMSGGLAAIVSAGGVMGLGQDLIRVPLSQLRYDANEDRVTLDVSREQIASITEADKDVTSSRAAE